MSQTSQLSEALLENEQLDRNFAAHCLLPISKDHESHIKLNLDPSASKIISPPAISQEARENELYNYNLDNDINGDITCPICYNDYSRDQMIKLSCWHIFCKDCIESYLKAKIDAFQPENIKCPQATCISIVNQHEIEIVLDQPTLEKYRNFLSLKAQARNPYTKYCPQTGCARVLNVDPTKKFTTCECGVLVCNECFQARHDRKSCADVLKEHYEPFMSNKELKMCLICKTGVEKWTGCPKIQCPICDYTWCWDCGNEYNMGHGLRCKKVWDPKPPKMFTGEKTSICQQFWTAIVLILEMLFFYMLVLVVTAIGWPFVSCLILSESKQSLGVRCLLTLLGFIGCVAVWPIAIVVVPVVYIVDEYFNFCREKRWRRGARLFGMANGGKNAFQESGENGKMVLEIDKREVEREQDNEPEIVLRKKTVENEDLEKGKVYRIEI